MRRFLHRARSLFIALALCAGGVPATAAPDDAPRIYRWVDSEGIVHYTADPERIPAALRGRLPQPAPAEAPTSRAVRTTSSDVWAERNRPPDAGSPDDADAFNEDFGVDDPAREARIVEIDAQIETLLGHISTDEELLKQRVVGAGVDPMSSGDDTELREIAARLPGLLVDLRGLRDERATLEAR